MHDGKQWGFTLIELLTVIAIIAILFSLVAVAAPRVLEKAKITRTENDFAQVNTMLVAYQTKNTSLPPGYGYLWFDPTVPGATAEAPIPNLQPYTSGRFANLQGVTDLYDAWSESYDANQNGQLDYFEYCPIGAEVVAGKYTFPPKRYDPSVPNDPDYAADVQRQMAEETRPYIYIPVNSEDALAFQRYCESGLTTDSNFVDKLYAREWNPDDPRGGNYLQRFARLDYYPSTLDAYVLICVGPVENTFGVVPTDNIAPANHQNWYYINALRAYYLATRDADRNGKLDFDFRTRSGDNEAQPRAAGYGKAPWNPGGSLPENLASELVKLPDGSMGYGPLIFKSAS